jgi:putative hydrolase of the HAD superfamily
MSAGADLSYIDTWLFDLDNTLYPPEAELMSLIEQRMTRFVQRQTGLNHDDAYALQKRYLHEHGTTLAGLMAHHGVDPEAFLGEVHDVSMAGLAPDAELRAAIAGLPGRRLVFTNGDKAHADRVLRALHLDDLFEAVFHIARADYVPKPHPDTFRRMIHAHDIDPPRSVFVEDTARNLLPAYELGMTTVLVGPSALQGDEPYVHHRTDNLTAFLKAARVMETLL